MYKNILVAIDLKEEPSCRRPLLAAIELARTFGAWLHVLTVVRDIDAILQVKAAATLGYDQANVADLTNIGNACKAATEVLLRYFVLKALFKDREAEQQKQ
jgi:nucleotide-binding universal stress UspA family protein